jgi:hypothetical protein
VPKTKESTATADGCLLSYFPSTSPLPIQVSSADTPLQGILNTAALNQGTTMVYCNQITINVPAGPDPNELFADSPKPTAAVNTGKWSVSDMQIKSARELGLDTEINYFSVTFDCRDASDFLIDYNLVFAVQGQVSQLPGDSTILIYEQSGTTSDPNSFTIKQTSYTVSAYTPQFYLQNFVATVPTAPTVPATEFGNGQAIRFSWESNGTYFEIYQKGNTTPPTPPIPPIYSGSKKNYTMEGGVATDTTFVLVGMMSGNPSKDQPKGNYAPIYLYQTISITISNPDLTPRSAAISGNASVGGTLGVTGVATLSNNASVGGTLGVSGVTTLNNNTTVGGTLGVSGATTLSNTTVGGTLNVSGNVGIGTTTPAALLDVNGTAQLRGTPGGSTGLTVDGNGDVGIGTTTPTTKLQVTGDTGLQVMRASNPDQTLTLTGGDGTGIAGINAYYQLNLNAHGSGPGGPFAGNANIVFSVLDDPKMVIDYQGNVSVTKGQLIVTGGPPTGFNVGCYFDRERPYNVNNTDWNANVSILAGYIVAQAVFAQGYASNSDERIKDIQGRSDGAEDLRTLLDIEVTDFRYKDVISQGSSPHKKLIAQQVEQVFPQAVSQRTDVVPDMYRPASFMDGWIALSTDLEKGERVRLISGKDDGVYEVLEVKPEKFRTDFKPEGDKVFVYGREVNDLRTVDYDAIAMLNVSATQHLKKEKDEEVNALRAENSDMKARLETLEAKDGVREARLAAMEEFLLSAGMLAARSELSWV